MNTGTITVWNIFIRCFHWTLVLGFTVQFITGKNEFYSIHELVGYYILFIMIVRIIYGCFGDTYAKFSNFVYSFSDIKNYTKDFIKLRSIRYIGHNPLGGLMVIMLMGLIMTSLLSGLIILALNEYEGILYFIGDWNIPVSIADIIEQIHEFVAHFSLFLIALHVLGVLFSSLMHKENLIKSMITGKKNIK